MNERERLMLMNSHLPENKGPNTFTLSLRKMVNGAPPPPRATKKRNLLKAIVHTAAAAAQEEGEAAAAAAAVGNGLMNPESPAQSDSSLLRKQGSVPSRFAQRGVQSEEVQEEFNAMGRFAKVGACCL